MRFYVCAILVSRKNLTSCSKSANIPTNCQQVVFALLVPSCQQVWNKLNLPILFLYINDIENCSKLISFILFADDTNIFYSNKCLKTLNKIMQTESDKVAEWLNANKLSLNTTKTKVILFRSSNKKTKQ
jgi:hypothetical protein